MSRLDDLLDGHFDGVLDAAGSSELAALLRQPAARAELVRRARFEALLRRAHPRQPARRWRWAIPLVAAAAVLAIGLAWFLTPAPAAPMPPPEPIAMVEGAVRTPEGRPLLRIEPGVPLVVEGDLPAVLRLADGSTSSLAPGTSATIRAAASDARATVELNDGQGRFDVPTHPDLFHVVTPAGRLSSRAGRFTVDHHADDEAMAVTVQAGRVEVVSGAVFASLAQGDRREFRTQANDQSARRRPAVLVAVEPGRVLLRHGREARNETVAYAVGEDTRVLIDGEPGRLQDLPPGTKVVIASTTGRILRELSANGPQESGVVSHVDRAAGTVAVRLNEGKRLVQLPFDRVHVRSAGGAAALVAGTPLRVRLSLDLTRALSASDAKPAAPRRDDR